MKARGTLLAVIIFILCIHLSAEYEEKCFLPMGFSSPNRFGCPIIKDVNINDNYEIFVQNFGYVYEISRKYKYYTVDTITDGFVCGVDYIDIDSLLDFVGRKGGGTNDKKLWLREQETIYSYPPAERTWESDTIFEGIDWLGVGDIKGDGVTRIYGAGIPEISSEVYRYGWFYMNCTGDNQYEIGGRVSPSTKSGGAMDVGDVNGNGKNDVIFASADSNGIVIFEYDTLSDSFVIKQDSIPVACEKVLYFPDIDKDGKNEIIRSTTENLLPPSYHFQLFEFDSAYNYDTIWDYTFWGTTDYFMTYGCDMSYGDVDNDGELEFVVCGGSTMRVFDVTGDNTFTEVYTKTLADNFFLSSSVKCWDFDNDGQDEIMFTGEGNPSSMEKRGTYIYKDEVISELWMEDTLDFGNQSVIDTITSQVVIKSVDTYNLVVDSVKVEGLRYKKSSEPTYPVILSTGDSMVVEVEYECIDTGISLGKLIAYSNDHYGGVDTMEIIGELEPTGIESHEIKEVTELQGIRVTGCNTIEWITQTTQGTLTVYDISGREVIKEESKASGTHKTNIRDLKNGIYFIKLKTENASITKKQIIIR
ncbi:MAG: T9SS type A sorting domain-containing protein [bacterium]|nr:T9SS type A sorting domain-containing protein [bacterium]